MSLSTVTPRRLRFPSADLWAERMARNWSRANLAARVGVTAKAVEGWERRGYNPRPEAAVQLAEVLGNPQWLSDHLAALAAAPTADGLLCACGSNRVKVRDSRPSHDSLRRRRHCLACGARWTTFEITEERLARLMATDSSPIVNAVAELARVLGYELHEASEERKTA